MISARILADSLSPQREEAAGMFHRRNESKEYMKEYRENNKERLSENAKEWKRTNSEKIRCSKLKYRYGITLEEYESMLTIQNNVCAICGSFESGRKNNKNLVVDHCHDSSKVRGLLCFNCNTGLGSFKDKASLLRLAADYLEK